MFGYTGTYKGKEISVMGGGMGMPSIGIYSYELFNFYDVDQIIRIGSAGALQDHIKADGCGDRYGCLHGFQLRISVSDCQEPLPPIADYELLNQAVETAKRQGTNVVVGNVAVLRCILQCDEQCQRPVARYGRAGSGDGSGSALYECGQSRKESTLHADYFGSYCIPGESLSAEDRQLGFGKMMEIALELA